MMRALAQNPIGKWILRTSRVSLIRALGVVRNIDGLRRALHLPVNQVADPLTAHNDRTLRIIALPGFEDFKRTFPRLPENPAVLSHFSRHAHEYKESEYVAVLPGGGIWGYTHGAVFTADNRFIPAFSRDPWGPKLHRVWTCARLPAAQKLTGRALYLVTPEASDNYHHWMIDLLPRLSAVERAGFPLNSFDHVIINHTNRAYQWETLHALGIRKASVLQLTPRMRVSVDELVIPSLKGSNETIPACHISFLRDRFLKTPSTQAKRRIFLSRRDAKARRLLNEAEILAMLEPYGVEPVTLGSMSVEQQAQLFSQSELIIGPSGAAFANLVFAEPGTEVIELASSAWLTVYHWMICARCRLNHTMVVGGERSPPDVLNIRGRSVDLHVPPEMLARALATVPMLRRNEARVHDLNEPTQNSSVSSPAPSLDPPSLPASMARA